MEAGHAEGIAELLAPTVILHSPVTYQPFQGPEAVGLVLRAVSEVFKEFRYVDALEGEQSYALFFEAKVGERELTGVDHFRATSDGRIAELTVLIRPLSGLTALAEAMRAKIEELTNPQPA